MNNILSKKSIIAFSIILIIIFVLIFFKENPANKEIPKKATLVKSSIYWDDDHG